MKTVKARLITELNVECPECEEVFDLFEDSDLNGDCETSQAAMPSNENWISAHAKFEQEYVCDNCGEEFIVKAIKY